MVLRLALPLAANLMGVVDTDQPFARRAVKRERVIEVVRLLRRSRNTGDDELDPEAAFGVDDKHLAVEIEKRVKAPVPILTLGVLLSERDNIVTARMMAWPRTAHQTNCRTTARTRLSRLP